MRYKSQVLPHVFLCHIKKGKHEILYFIQRICLIRQNNCHNCLLSKLTEGKHEILYFIQRICLIRQDNCHNCLLSQPTDLSFLSLTVEHVYSRCCFWLDSPYTLRLLPMREELSLAFWRGPSRASRVSRPYWTLWSDTLTPPRTHQRTCSPGSEG